MPSCPECDTALNVDVDEVEEGDVIACEECGTEYEVVGVEPLELARMEEGIEEEDDLLEESSFFVTSSFSSAGLAWPFDAAHHLAHKESRPRFSCRRDTAPPAWDWRRSPRRSASISSAEASVICSGFSRS
jgi:alpha-aminoadipate/glutamate carrier protein LysW